MFEGHPSWRSILDFYAKGLLLVLLAAFIVDLVTRIGDGDPDVALVSLVCVFGVGIVIVAGFVKRIATRYTITDRRLNIKRGIVSREVQETRLERVQNVNFSQGLLQRLLQIGDVDFDTAAGDDYNFVFAGVADPEDVVEQVDRATHSGAAGSHGLGEPGPTQRLDR